MIISRQNRGGLTLIEILVSIAVGGILLGAAYSVYAASVSAWNTGRRRIDMHQRARVSLDLISRSLRCAHAPDDADSVFFTGNNESIEPAIDPDLDYSEEEMVWDADRIAFRTNAPFRLFEDEAFADQAEIAFYLEAGEAPDGDEDTVTSSPAPWSTLFMRIDPSFDEVEDDGGWLIELAEGVEQLDFRYFNGREWVDQWTSSAGVPKAVEATIVIADLDGQENSVPFSRICRIETWREYEEGGAGEETLRGARAMRSRGNGRASAGAGEGGGRP